MSSSKSWNGVTNQIFSCVKQKSEKDHGTVYDPPDADSGKATTDTPVGNVVLGFNLADSTLTYTIEHKPFIVSDSQIWDGINDTINACR